MLKCKILHHVCIFTGVTALLSKEYHQFSYSCGDIRHHPWTCITSARNKISRLTNGTGWHDITEMWIRRITVEMDSFRLPETGSRRSKMCQRSPTWCWRCESFTCTVSGSMNTNMWLIRRPSADLYCSVSCRLNLAQYFWILMYVSWFYLGSVKYSLHHQHEPFSQVWLYKLFA